MAISELASSVEPMTAKLRQLLERARQIKPSDTVEPPLSVSEFSGELNLLLDDGAGGQRRAPNSVFETAARGLLYDYVATTSIDDPAFVHVWNLLDIVQICGDQETCDAALVFWLVEELLDSQSIDGCRKVFDWLESRRERLVAKDFNQTKNLIVLRSCNELLRRLSRAEDAVFCGRVFIFLFQSFPLGDKSSVNLRGEFHVENVTSFEESAQPLEESAVGVEVDAKVNGEAQAQEPHQAREAEGAKGESDKPVPEASKKAITRESSKSKEDALNTDALYPIFWTLQQSFSNPLRLFTRDYFNDLRVGLDMTLQTFKKVPKVLQAKQDDNKRGVKRKQGQEHDQFASNFNPKYLTSRDLFKLELSDLAFQRHILVQALILIDFLLSLTERSKKKLYKPNTQKALQYSYTLSDEDTEWALATKGAIANYLKEGPEGNFYYRMVDTVLSRDKNWVRWKMENCPPIARDSISTTDYSGARSSSHKAFTNKRIRETPLGALDLNFLADSQESNGSEVLKGQDRYTSPQVEALVKGIGGDDLDLEMAVTSEEKERLQEAKAGKTWQALRIASKHKLSQFDKIDDGKNLHVLFEQENVEEGTKDEVSSSTEPSDHRAAGSVPEQTRPLDQRADQAGPAMSEAAVK